MRILVVDDNRENRYMLQALLRGNNFRVVAAENGEEALEKGLSESFDLVIADILMPKMDGFQLCREWMQHERLKEIPFVFYTATYTDPQDKEFALKLGASKYIVKPIEPLTFMKIINKVIDEVQRGCLPSPGKPISEEKVYLKKYNQMLVQKLQDKLLQLRQLEEKYRNLLESAGDAIFSLDQNGIFTYCNSLLEHKLNYIAAELSGQHFSFILRREEEHKFRSSVDKVIEKGETVPLLTEFVAKAGTKISFEVNLTPIWRGKELIGIQGIARDITDRLKLEKRVKRSEKLASMAELATIIAHEIRNPLGAITNSIGVLNQKLDLEQKLKELMQIVVEETRRINLIISEFLKFARLKKSRFSECRIDSLIQETLLMLQEDERYKPEIRITQQYEADLPLLWLDPDQIRQVFWNLLINVIEAMPEGGSLKLNIKKHKCEGAPGISVDITDTGAGINSTVMNKIFEPFFTTKPDGSGLGLPVVQQIIETHGGLIDIKSQKGVGTKVMLFLPAQINHPQNNR